MFLTIIQIATILLISFQIYLIYKTYKAHHERVKKQSTIEFINSTYDKFKPITRTLKKKFSGKVINLDQIDEETKTQIKEFLEVAEMLAVGINAGVYDFEIFKRISGTYFLLNFNRLRPYIESEQKEFPSAYIEFQNICKKLEDAQFKTKSPFLEKGSIKHS